MPKRQKFFAFRETNSNYKGCLQFIYIEDYSIKEIAASLDMKDGTVKWHLNEGRNKLKVIFQNNLIKVANVG